MDCHQVYKVTEWEIRICKHHIRIQSALKRACVACSYITNVTVVFDTDSLTELGDPLNYHSYIFALENWMKPMHSTLYYQICLYVQSL